MILHFLPCSQGPTQTSSRVLLGVPLADLMVGHWDGSMPRQPRWAGRAMCPRTRVVLGAQDSPAWQVCLLRHTQVMVEL